LKNMFCIHTDISNKPDLIVNDLSTSTSTSHAYNSKLDSIDIKHVIDDTTCLDNSCLTNHVMPNSKEQEYKVSLFLSIIIVGRLVILGQIVIC
jgi:hypothetical protein